MRHTVPVLLLALSAWLVPTAHAEVPITLDAPIEDPPVPRFRIGAEVGVGVAYGATNGLSVSGFLQAGAQITRQLGVFYQGGLLGFGFGDAEENLDGFMVSSHSAMVDLTFGNVAQVGIGGGVDVGRLVYCDEDTGLCGQDDVGAHPSLSLRAAFLVAFVRNRARWGIPIALHAHTILWEHRAQNALVLTVGFSRY